MNGGGGAAAVAPSRRPSSQQVRRRRRQRCGCIAYATSAPDSHGHNNNDNGDRGRGHSHGHGTAQTTSASDGDGDGSGGGNCSGGGGSLRFSAKAVQSTISAVAGIAVAAAVGGTLIYSRRVWHAFRRLVRHTGLVIRQAFFKSWNCCSCEVSSKRFGSRQLQLSWCLIYEKIHLSRRRKKYPRLTKEHWENAFDSETGCLNNTHKVLKRIRYGGIDPAIRAQVWPFLLGMYGFDSTHEERAAQRVFKREEYENLKRQCSYMRSATMSKARQAMVEVDLIDLTSDLDMGQGMASNNNESANKNNKKNEVKEEEEGFGTWQRIIRLDASRMDMEWVLHSPFESDGGGGVGSRGRDLDARREQHAARLIAILEAYAVYDPETGYCQGMGDLLSPFVALLEEDFEAFWCFACFMEAIRHNFRIDEMGIQRQLSAVSRIIGAGDPPLYHYLEQIEAQDCMFVYRMVVVLMRRELSFKQTVALWEVVWADKASAMLAEREGVEREAGTGDRGGDDARRKNSRGKAIPPPTDDLLLYVIAAAVCQKRKLILNKCTCMDDVLRECNSMAGHLDVWSLLDDARGLLFAAVHEKTS